MDITSINANYTPLRSIQNFGKGNINLGKDMREICGLDDEFLKNWEERLPDDTSITFICLPDNRIFKIHEYKPCLAYGDHKDNPNGHYSLILYNNKNDEELKNDNKEKLNRFLKDCLGSLKVLKDMIDQRNDIRKKNKN